jgi:hypothetical protein
MAIKLTDASVKALPTPTKGNHITYDDGDVGGFGVRVTAGGARSAAASTEQAYLETRQRAQAAYAKAEAELARIEPARSVDELLPLIDAAKPACRVRVDSTGRQTVCSKPSGLLAELGRAQERQRLTDAMDKASATLSIAPAKPANSDSVAISGFLSILGWDVSPARVNGWLVLLSVVLLECGAGLSLAVREGLTIAVAAASTGQSGQSDQATERTASRPAATGPTEQSAKPIKVTPASDIEHALRVAGGSIASFKALADRVGRPKSSVAIECHKLASAGRVALTRNGRGTKVALGPQSYCGMRN